MEGGKGEGVRQTERQKERKARREEGKLNVCSKKLPEDSELLLFLRNSCFSGISRFRNLK